MNARRRKNDGSYEEGETVDVEGTVVQASGKGSSGGSEQASPRGGSRGKGEAFRALKAREAASKASTQ